MTSSASATSSPRHDPLLSPRTSLCMYSSDNRRATSSHTLPLTAHSPHLYQPNRRAVSAVSTCTHKHNRAQLRCERRSRRRIHRGPSAALVTCPRPVSDPTSGQRSTSTQCCATCRQCCATSRHAYPHTRIRAACGRRPAHLSLFPPRLPVPTIARQASRGRFRQAWILPCGSRPHVDPVSTRIPSARGSRHTRSDGSALVRTS